MYRDYKYNIDNFDAYSFRTDIISVYIEKLIGKEKWWRSFTSSDWDCLSRWDYTSLKQLSDVVTHVYFTLYIKDTQDNIINSFSFKIKVEENKENTDILITFLYKNIYNFILNSGLKDKSFILRIY